MLADWKRAVLDRLWCGDVILPTTGCGAQELYRQSRGEGITRSDVSDYLAGKRSYTLHRITTKRFPRQRILSSRPRETLACDLAEVQQLANDNNGVRYLLICIDIFSRFLRVVPLRNKWADTCARALSADALA